VDTWLHHDRLGSVVLQTDAGGGALASFPATGRMIEGCTGSEIDPRWELTQSQDYAGQDAELVADAELAALTGRGRAQALHPLPSEEGMSLLIAGEQAGWWANPNDEEWDEPESHVVSFAANWSGGDVQIRLRGERASGGPVEIVVRFGPWADTSSGGGVDRVNPWEDVPSGVWGQVAFDAAALYATHFPGESLAELDGVMVEVESEGDLRLADFALLGRSHAAYSAWGESLASAQTGDVLSPLAQASAWSRPDAGSPVGWQSKQLDPALGLHFNHARFYNAGLGRFTQASPLGADFEHLYGYGLNSPQAFTDVNGLSPFDMNVMQRVAEARAYENFWANAMGVGPLYDYAPGGCRDQEWESIQFWGQLVVEASLSFGTWGISDTLNDADLALQGDRVAMAAVFLPFVSTRALRTTGQLHHAISAKVHRELERHPNLSGRYRYRDSRLATRAIDSAAHRGYQRWHRDLDNEVAGWIARHRTATPQQFEAYLHEVYSRPELLQRFPNGL
jgi:RHS repeat-associated protein